ncbi:hypothetical protein LEP1GSC060_3478 [Leptospira weilii serovar Ranarum str. ICFT]|uniref:Uncharacterized protein n=2 Tax=Leptospira weilii TaxID=28184 RepID=N1WI52_9LEPT|nr:hypothetical protein LEP1GSC060_3478 [Leptospira weilii serovar Ranarum str. ICFT]
MRKTASQESLRTMASFGFKSTELTQRRMNCKMKKQYLGIVTKLLILGIHIQIFVNCKQTENSNESLLTLLVTTQLAANCATPQLSGENIPLKFSPYKKTVTQYMGSLGYLNNFEFGRRIQLDMKESIPAQYSILFYNANSPCDVPQDYSKNITSFSYLSARVNKTTTYSLPLSGNLMALATSYGASNTAPTDITLSIESSPVCKNPTTADATLRTLPFNFKATNSLAVIKIGSYTQNQQIVFTSNTTNLGNLQTIIVTGTDACYPTTYKAISFNQNAPNQNQVSWSSSTESGPLVILVQYFSESTTTAPNDIKVQIQ